jgi:erythronate-4-phosphate dehydrogenase
LIIDNLKIICNFAGNMKIVVDNKIPYISEKLAQIADEVVYLPGAAITADDVRDADALIVRTRTRCDEQLLKGSSVKLVATATIGFDHIDTEWLERAGIQWTNCPGCNAGSVAQYLECSLILLQRDKGLCLKNATIGIVGCGHVGSKVKAVAERLGMHVLVCDPPLEQLANRQEPKANSQKPTAISFTSMDVIEREADVITFHVPLTRDGAYATWHMGDDAFFHRLSRVPYIINTSRGEVVDNDALLSALNEGRVADAVIDVWEHEPHLNEQLLQRVFIGTPHIAGYSADGKVNADNMVIDALCRQFRLPHPGKIVPPSVTPSPLPSSMFNVQSSTFNVQSSMFNVQSPLSPLTSYNPLTDSEKLKNDPSSFEFLRNNYPVRREQIGM